MITRQNDVHWSTTYEETPVTDSAGILTIVALDSANASDPDAFQYPADFPKLANEPVWAVYEHDPDEDAWTEVASGLTLAEAESR